MPGGKKSEHTRTRLLGREASGQVCARRAYPPFLRAIGARAEHIFPSVVRLALTAYLARSKSTRMSFSESPLHLDTTLEAEILKKVVLHSVATALASIVLPVPGGP